MKEKRPLKYWLYASQPWALPASAAPALVGYGYLFYLYKTGVVSDVNWINGIIAVIGVMIIHLSANTMGEYHDFVNGVDQKEKTGPIRVLVKGYFKPKTILIYGLSLLAVGSAIGIYLLSQTGWPLLIFGFVGVFSAAFYHKFKYKALGEPIIFLTFGLMIALGVVYVLTHQIIWSTLLVVAPTGLLIVAILHANNIRDLELDRSAGVRTQVMNLGIEGSQIVYQTLLYVAYLLIALAVMVNVLHPASFMVLLSFPMANKNIKLGKQATEDNLEIVQFLDTYTAKLVLVFSLLLVTGNVIAAYL